MKYTHYISFVCTQFNNETFFTTVKSNNKMITISELKQSVADQLRENGAGTGKLLFGIKNISTVRND